MNFKAHLEIFNIATTIGLTVAIPLLFILDQYTFSTINYAITTMCGINWVLIITNNQMARELWDKWTRK
ncbi:hypothetical protein [Pontibacillus marinus]|uniref:Uncharacterized protein n=1 Tax=Pontibacillus marinus BH030004 = DSM 16465 TaxID=1385511 RepID=A0A0A5GCX1_9BACI|nr:hypothetical protein [Pontibacillus marinus]KGX91046.1 hypothetical protein N783_13610 [Pontibacillus marinus BH030004 = DSM 16465]